ncbi:hypothetical protein N657DRAFT_664952 [Parathielavia appendiculata]|uniref:DUF6546 domain-containing protein n=1 Tax=Parathielavia appendiculata TaxID=2587402 RepID=A0AAN6TY32_9PEZI|nr:hypothetical protein N657DRAFT_664952 [Parathielavia appendiculata]
MLEAIPQQKHPGWTSLAWVCREWQLTIEKENFRQLKLQAPCLDSLERLSVRQRGLVRHVLLDIELPRCTCRSCKLLGILGTWKSARGLTLELSVHCPSDSHLCEREAECNWHDPKHGWIRGRQVTDPPLLAILRLFAWISLSNSCLPQTLRRVTVFQEFSNRITAALSNSQMSPWLGVDGSNVVDPGIGAALPPGSLALTSQLLQRTASFQKIDALLYEAGSTALQMPGLRSMVLWNGGEGNACEFIYRTDSAHASVNWRSMWDMELSPRVVEIWQHVAFESCSLALRVGKHRLRGVIGLPCQIVTPASLRQIRREAMLRAT